MGKQGPCCHCGVTSTPLWRNGPPDKPVLCNACGSRWRTKGTLANYIPIHARAEPDDFADYKVSRLKSISPKNKEANVLKRKQNYNIALVGGATPDYNQGLWKNIGEDTSTRSSTGSAISNSESCVQYGSTDANDLTGPVQSIVWDAMVPSRKRTCFSHSKPSPVEKLTKDLYNILQAQSSYFSGSSEEDLLFESDTPMVSVEIGHGSVLIRHPSSISQEEESEVSSLSIDNKLQPLNEAYSPLTILKHANFPSLGIEKIKKPIGKGIEKEQLKREKDQHEKLEMLGNHDSPPFMDLRDIPNYDEFVSHLTNDEQQQLYLPPVDTAKVPDRNKDDTEDPQKSHVDIQL